MDDLAYRLGMDPVELRLRNEPDHDQTTGLPFSTRRLPDCLRQGAATFGWARRNPVPAVGPGRQPADRDGMAAAGYHTSRSQSDALARVNADGSADVQSATSEWAGHLHVDDAGGRRRASACRMSRVRFALGDSRFPAGAVALGLAHHGECRLGGVHSANMLRDRFIRTAVVDPGSPLYGRGPRRSTSDGRMCHSAMPARGESYQDLLRRRGWPSLDSQQTWSPDDADTTLLDVRLRRGVRRGRCRRSARHRADPADLRLL